MRMTPWAGAIGGAARAVRTDRRGAAVVRGEGWGGGVPRSLEAGGSPEVPVRRGVPPDDQPGRAGGDLLLPVPLPGVQGERLLQPGWRESAIRLPRGRADGVEDH